ncbi:cytochrome c oxidase subunit 2A [Cytobacillus praedii]|uniref:Cytochrome c oxidase subunit 2A n=1 Tax=Cytobacillus praedii TaxID=1742358 RepID=A0A4R1AXA5_9BACI|nr:MULTISPECIES: cytochrome c oxidase subunit 2A [Cytobacillus]MED3551677.1 cytochrome c oxidase subunit 2A [Cytobacillus praedii]MED3574545.1 cytochrome c oxidase subunit 2A [Cytobacillus praedii]TCJ02575.1 cytochrome c oxidase subunit 2A [Cytobacillus praedii]
METKVNKTKTEVVSTEEETHKGTIISVSVVGLVILITYLVLYGLFMARY